MTEPPFYGEVVYVWSLQCPLDSPGDCLLHCKHWRSNILRACKALGWVVPNVIALSREALWRGAHGEDEDDDFGGGGYCDAYFDLRDGRPESSDTKLPATLTVDGDFQATLDLVAAMYSRLAGDWLPRLKQMADRHRYVQWPDFSAAIEKITQELGVEVPDVYYASEEWHQTSDGEVDSNRDSDESHDDDGDSNDSHYVDVLEDFGGRDAATLIPSPLS